MRRGAINNLVVIIIVAIVIIATIIVISVMNGNKNKGEGNQATPNNTVQATERPNIEGNEYVKEENGLKTNTSDKLKENKKYENYTFTNIRLQTDTNGSVLLADVTTSASQKQEGKQVTIKFVNKEGKEIAKIGAYIGQIKPGETKTFRTETTTDITNVYDFIIE